MLPTHHMLPTHLMPPQWLTWHSHGTLRLLADSSVQLAARGCYTAHRVRERQAGHPVPPSGALWTTWGHAYQAAHHTQVCAATTALPTQVCAVTTALHKCVL